MRILLIEPDAILAQTYQVALVGAGYDILHASSAQDAVHVADEQVPDLVILEWQLIAHNGAAFLQEFRSYYDWRDIPVVLLTLISPAGRTQERAILQRDFGVVAWLYKPQTTLTQLLTIVQGLEKTYLQSRRQPA